MKKLSILFFASIVVMFSACEKVTGEGDVRTETRSSGDFSGIESRISGNIFYMPGNEHKIELTAQQNILNVIETPVINNKVVVRFKNDVRVRSHEKITIRITAPSISSLSASGSGNVTVSGPVTGNSLYFSLSGSGNMTLPMVTASHLEATISGSGNISIAGGTAATSQYKISGSGSIEAQGVGVKSATENTSGSGNVKLNASESLKVTISGSGSVFYLGKPVINTSISGSGRVIPL
jgi:hypothetical protein